jgi:hypothetical protein
VFENAEWAKFPGDSLAYMPHLRKDALAGMQPKSIIFQFDTGDQNVSNPISSAMLRAGELADRATYYRHDLAFAERPNLPKNGHGFLTGISNPAWRDIALGAQEQIATFFESDGTEIIQPQPSRFFETPIQGPLPEDLNFIPTNPPRGSPAPMSSSSVYGPTPTNPAGGSLPTPSLFSPVQFGGKQGASDATPSAPPPQELPSRPQVASADGLFASLYQERPKRIAPRSKAAVPGEPNSMSPEVVLEEAGLMA